MPMAISENALVRLMPGETVAAVPGRTESFLYLPISVELTEAEAIFNKELDTRAPYVRDLMAHLAHYRGKRLRPTLLLLTAKATGTMHKEHPILAAVVEMIHTATLVHDDILDSADMRRHVATINARWGNASSVLLGDLLFTHAFHLASKTGSALACELIGEATNKVCEGELRQIGEQGNLRLTEADYYSIIAGKTAALTACCCQLGAHYAGASSSVVNAMTRYGHLIGMAFQVADDVLDLIGTEQETGKSLGTDVLQKKLTLPLINLLQQGTNRSQEAHEILEAPSDSRLARLRTLLLECQSIAYAQREAERMIKEAREILKMLPASECRQILDEMTARIIHRNC